MCRRTCGVPELQHAAVGHIIPPSCSSDDEDNKCLFYLEESTGSGAGIGLGTEADADLALVFSVPYFE